MRDALNATGRPIVFSLCGWNPWYSNPDPALNYTGGKELANLWRIGPDDTNWNGVLANININSQLAANAGPDKGWNDPCLLLAEDLNGNLRVTQLQSRAQFSMWAVMASPLIISANIRNMSSMNIETYTNAEVIAVDQVYRDHVARWPSFPLGLSPLCIFCTHAALSLPSLHLHLSSLPLSRFRAAAYTPVPRIR